MSKGNAVATYDVAAKHLQIVQACVDHLSTTWVRARAENLDRTPAATGPLGEAGRARDREARARRGHARLGARPLTNEARRGSRKPPRRKKNPAVKRGLELEVQHGAFPMRGCPARRHT